MYVFFKKYNEYVNLVTIYKCIFFVSLEKADALWQSNPRVSPVLQL